MADQSHLDVMDKGVEAWNRWRKEEPSVTPDLRDAQLSGRKLQGIDLSRGEWRANLIGAQLDHADLTGANLKEASLNLAQLTGAFLVRADLRDAELLDTTLHFADLSGADCRDANMFGADMSCAKLVETKFQGATLRSASLYRSDLTRANLADADLFTVNLTGATVDNTVFTRCKVFGVSAWALKGTPEDQQELDISGIEEPSVTVDDLEVAQFIYLMLNNEKIRHVIDTITSKVVLILGAFSNKRKPTLDRLRHELRQRNLTPVVFDFGPSEHQSIMDTVQLLARMSRYVIIDLTDPRMTPMELGAIAEHGVPIQPLILHGQKDIAGLAELRSRRPWLLPVFRYRDDEHLVAYLDPNVIGPADEKREELRRLLAAARAEALGFDPSDPS
jgi:hypothetical protein